MTKDRKDVLFIIDCKMAASSIGYSVHFIKRTNEFKISQDKQVIALWTKDGWLTLPTRQRLRANTFESALRLLSSSKSF